MLDLKNLYLNGSGIKEMTGLHHLKNLEKLDLSNNQRLKKLELTQDMPNLKDLDLNGSGIEEITGLHHLKNLESLNLSDTKQLKKLEFTQDIADLKPLVDVIRNSGISRHHQIEGIEFLDNE